MGNPGKRYKSAPITEAVIELRIQPQESFALAALDPLAKDLERAFPKQAKMRRFQMVARADKPEQSLNVSSSEQEFGIRLANGDDSRILQLRREGLAYSHMAPYSEWATFRAEARPLWDKYRLTYKDAKLARCGLRYINRIDIPQARVELSDYFHLYPFVPPALPQHDVSGMIMNLQIPQHDLECLAVINQAQVTPAKENHLSIILDIDLFRQGIESWSDEDAWNFLDKLRNRKNEIFETCITNRVRELIDR